jgi:hypothetical protein
LKNDKIWPQWASSIPSKIMLEKVWSCKHFKMESWRWTICCLICCSKGRKHVHVLGNRRPHVALRCCWKRKVLLSTHAKASRRKQRNQPQT